MVCCMFPWGYVLVALDMGSQASRAVAHPPARCGRSASPVSGYCEKDRTMGLLFFFVGCYPRQVNGASWKLPPVGPVGGVLFARDT